MKRLNHGKNDGLPILVESFAWQNGESNVTEFWTIADRGQQDGFERWKLYASDGSTVSGKANYSLVLQNKILWTKDGGGDLKKERPGLFSLVASYASGDHLPVETLAENPEEDLYGDVALSRGAPLTQSQQWKRGLVQMRIYELEYESKPLAPGVVRAESWEEGIRQRWIGIYRGSFEQLMDAHKVTLNAAVRKQGAQKAVYDLTMLNSRDMPQAMIDEAIAFIKRRGPAPFAYEDLLKVLRDYYAGKFKPESMATLVKRLDEVSGYSVSALFEPITATEIAERENVMLKSITEAVTQNAIKFYEALGGVPEKPVSEKIDSIELPALF